MKSAFWGGNRFRTYPVHWTKATTVDGAKWIKLWKWRCWWCKILSVLYRVWAGIFIRNTLDSRSYGDWFIWSMIPKTSCLLPSYTCPTHRWLAALDVFSQSEAVRRHYRSELVSSSSWLTEHTHHQQEGENKQQVCCILHCYGYNCGFSFEKWLLK